MGTATAPRAATATATKAARTAQVGAAPAASAAPGAVALCLAQDTQADALLASDPFALMVGMLLDQQYPMEHAFRGPAKLAAHLGIEHLDVATIAAMDPEIFALACSTPPAIHRYARMMAGRIQTMARYLVENYDGDAAAVWTGAKTGADLFARLHAIPGWGEMKAKIFLALLGKQLEVRPRGWREAAGAYGDKGSRRSVADVVDATTLAEVRAFKKATKAGLLTS